MKIAAVRAREIFDSRGAPTIICQLTLEDGTQLSASVPAGKSRSPYETAYLYDGGQRMGGKGVNKAVHAIESLVTPALIGKTPDVIVADMLLLELNGNAKVPCLGANGMLAVSIAVCRAQAYIEQLKLYELIAYLCEFDSVSLPIPLFNLINGGAHAHNDLVLQEFMVVPVSAKSFRQALEIGLATNRALEDLLQEHDIFFGYGDEGGVSALFGDEANALDLLSYAAHQVEKEDNTTIMLALDAAASQWYDAQKQCYMMRDTPYSTTDLISWYANLVEQYPMYALEDGFMSDDWKSWQELSLQLGTHIHLIGDDIYATQPERLWAAINQGLTTDVLIKPDQIGTLTQTFQVAKMCKEQDLPLIVSHRSGETDDSFIADLAVGLSANHIKAGGLHGSEHLSKYNRLLMIEEELLLGS